MKLKASQQVAENDVIDAIRLGNRIVSLSGPAGTGKTTLIKSLVERLKYIDFEDFANEDPEIRSVAVCTPTNKAAQVLCSKGIDATTFFKRFYILEEEVANQPRFVSCKQWLADGKPLPEGKISHIDYLVIDEGSMVTSRQINEMRKMCGVLILVGDHNQLPPVADRDHPAGVFCSLRHTATLSEVLRQDKDSPILALATAVRNDDKKKVSALVRTFEPDVDFEDLVRDGAQMIAYTNKERQRINHVCRRILGYTVPHPMPGDRLLITNNYSDDLVNGTVVTVVDFEWDWVKAYALVTMLLVDGSKYVCSMSMLQFINDQIGSQKDILFERFKSPKADEEINAVQATFAYCLTAHKSQGSEWPTVVVFDQRSLVRKIQSSDPQAGLSPDEYERRWFYTAITRAQKRLVVAPIHFAKATVRHG